MAATDLLVDAFDRVREVVLGAIDGLTPDQLAWRMDGQTNSIGWLVWHLTRVQDDHVAAAADIDQVWTARDYVSRFALPFDRLDTGYGHTPAEVAGVRGLSGDLLAEYHEAVRRQTIEYVRGLGDRDFDRIVDRSWNPPVTLAVRLVSVISDDLQHAGQAAFVRGMLDRR
ncbi:MAG TPA: DUF664 domain-containing protein [Pseudonocardiaceae bacterium]|jgi:hypothetical protein|nr:DUF664 domain-containing protein [Pseudonocardiaceae bacterium]